jgi:hypothetical protein
MMANMRNYYDERFSNRFVSKMNQLYKNCCNGSLHLYIIIIFYLWLGGFKAETN